jgi:uncharacterized membrane protein
MQSNEADTPVFSALIKPHRSLNGEAYRILITCLCLATLVSSIPFMVMGAWPVAGYFGLDLIALLIAFRVNFRQAQAYEEVVLSYVELVLRQVSPRGETREWRLNPQWVRIERQDDEEFGLRHIAIVSGPTRIDVAGQLSPAERADFLQALEAGLLEVRRGPRYHS